MAVFDAHINFGFSSVLVAPSPAASGTSLTLAAGEGARFPAAASGSPATHFNIVVSPANTFPLGSTAEVMRCTNRATDVLTVTRQQEGSSARTVLVGDLVSAPLTAKQLTDLETAVNAITSGNSTSTGAEASPPGSPVVGDLFLPNDSYYLQRWSGSLWVPWGPIFPLVEPVSGDFVWINQGTATIDTTKGGVFLTTPANGGGVNNIRIRKKAAPSVPYTVTMVFRPLFLPSSGLAVGMVFRQSSDGKLVTFEAVMSGGVFQVAVEHWTSPSAFSATPFLAAWHAWATIFFRIADNNTNRIYSISNDGQHWIDLFSETRTTFLTADEVGFFANANNAANAAAMTVLSWVQG